MFYLIVLKWLCQLNRHYQQAFDEWHSHFIYCDTFEARVLGYQNAKGAIILKNIKKLGNLNNHDFVNC